jgi:hypothetical protein
MCHGRRNQENCSRLTLADNRLVGKKNLLAAIASLGNVMW